MITYPNELEVFSIDGFTLRGGFISLSENFKTLCVVSIIQENPERRLRLGVAKELLSFWKQNPSHCPDCFVSLDFDGNKFIAVSNGRSKVGTGSIWDKSFGVFVVGC